jgi:asparagine synthase (glutamine-hydrolysing)
MCAIVGILNASSRQPAAEDKIRQMLAMVRHRGPDQFGIYLDDFVGLGNARLSIIDLASGQQPICNETGDLWIVFNGEIFNHVELRQILETKGHRFETHCDTEVILHAFEEYGRDCLQMFNGQFAFAIWNAKTRELFMARDRLGVRPLFYTLVGGDLVFGSEIKAILTDSRVTAEIDPEVLDQVFTYWCALPSYSIFKNILELPPGHFMEVRGGKIEVTKFWDLEFPHADPNWTRQSSLKSIEAYEEEFTALLTDATRKRLAASVPVGAYLSGGLDSSVVAAIVQKLGSNHLDTFSITFEDPVFNEEAWQRTMASFLGTDHHVAQISHADIGRVFPDVIWHTEIPLTRTGPAPMYLLSKLVHHSGYKVVLSGEGADEFLGGYDIFKEARIRNFWARFPDSKWRPLLFQKLYRDIPGLQKTNSAMLAAFFKAGLEQINAPDYSHAIRWRNNRRNSRYFSKNVKAAVASSDKSRLESWLDPNMGKWHPLSRAQFLEIKIFLSQYLLSSQGDRMGMANSVESRFPFLDYRVVEFCNRLPASLKLRGLTEKYLLRRLASRLLPREISERPKRPYRAPIHRSFFNAKTSDYVVDLLSEKALADSGLFDQVLVKQLVGKVREGRPIGEVDDMAVVAIVSTQLIHHRFVKNFQKQAALNSNDDVKVCRQSLLRQSNALR